MGVFTLVFCRSIDSNFNPIFMLAWILFKCEARTNRIASIGKGESLPWCTWKRYEVNFIFHRTVFLSRYSAQGTYRLEIWLPLHALDVCHMMLLVRGNVPRFSFARHAIFIYYNGKVSRKLYLAWMYFPHFVIENYFSAHFSSTRQARLLWNFLLNYRRVCRAFKAFRRRSAEPKKLPSWIPPFVIKDFRFDGFFFAYLGANLISIFGIYFRNAGPFFPLISFPSRSP